MFSVLRKMGWFFRLEWKRYTIATVLLIIVGIFEIIPPLLVGGAIDDIGLGRMTWDRIGIVIAQLLGITVLVYVISYIWLSRLFGGSFQIERIMRSRLMHHYLRMTPTFYERNRTGDLMARATNDLQAIGQTAGLGILTFVDSTLWMATLLITMIGWVSWKLTLASIIPLPLMALLVTLYGRWLHERFTQAQEAFSHMNEGVLETVSGVRVNRAYAQERAAERKFAEVTEDVLEKNIAVARIDALFEPTIKILVGASYLIGLGYGAYLVYQSELTIGNLVAFNVYLGMLIWPMFAIGELINVMQRGGASLDRVNETLGTPAAVTEPDDPIEPDAPGTLEYRHVTFRYPSSVGDNLKDISFKLEDGETLGLVGRTGSGKTTLIKQLLREYPAGQGEVLFSGVPITSIGMDRLKSWYGYVPQEQFLFSRTIRRNLLFASDGATETDLEEAVRISAFRKDLAFLPEGLETLVGEKGVALSGGQKQRIALARALLANPRILLLDDAMSAVDARTEAEIVANIRSARQGKTTVIATHRLSAVMHADRILVLDDGKIVEAGTHEQLISLGGWYKQQFERQQFERAEQSGGERYA